MTAHILDLFTRLEENNLIEKYDFTPFKPFLPQSLDKSDTIRISTHSNDSVLHLSESVLLITGRVKAADATKQPKSTPVPNFGAHLFEEARLSLGGVDLDRTRNPGMVSTIRNELVPTPGEARVLEMAGAQESKTVMDGNDFSLLLPVKTFMGSANDYEKVFCNVPLELTLLRSRTDKNALFCETDETDTIELTSVTWYVGKITLSDEGKLFLLNIINNDAEIEVNFRQFELYDNPISTNVKDSWNVLTTSTLERPRMFVVVFQTKRFENMKSDNSKFDLANMNDVRLFLNSEMVPYSSFNVEAKKGQALLAYLAYTMGHKNINQSPISEPTLGYKAFVTDRPMFVFDCSQKRDLYGPGACDVRLEWLASEKVPDGTIGYCLALNEKKFVYHAASGNLQKLV